VHIHLSETAGEVAEALRTHGRTPIQLAESCGLFDVPALVAHATHATEQDAELLAGRGAAVAHNPVSNLKLGAGVAPLPQLRATGVRLGLGTDSVASNNNLDLFEEIKVGTVVQRGVHQIPDLVAGSDLLDMATRDGAAALGFAGGVLEPGRPADVIVVSTASARATPMHSATSFLSFSARGSDVRGVIVGGRELMRDGALCTLDEDAIRAEADERARRIANAVAGRETEPGC
jgi:5-methylthioadenosine/S-adenosylhomocysteine deaminase